MMTLEQAIEAVQEQNRSYGTLVDIQAKEHPFVKGVFSVKGDEIHGKNRWPTDYVVFGRDEWESTDFTGPTGPGASTGWEDDEEQLQPVPLRRDEDGIFVWSHYDAKELDVDERCPFRPYEHSNFVNPDLHKRVDPEWKEGEMVYIIAFNEGGYGSITVCDLEGKRVDQFYAS